MTTTQINPDMRENLSSPSSLMRKQMRPGFSLIELTAVLVILGLLMAGAAVAVPGQIKRAKIRVTKSSMTTIKTAVNTYMADNAGDAPALIMDLIPSYIESGSELDAFSQPYFYRPTPGTSNPFELISSGPDKELGTPDDINVWTMDVKTGS
mgnify:CR=1 FL=1